MLVGKRLQDGRIHILFPPKGIVPLSVDEIESGAEEALSEEFKTLSRLKLIEQSYEGCLDDYIWVAYPDAADTLVGANLLYILY